MSFQHSRANPLRRDGHWSERGNAGTHALAIMSVMALALVILVAAGFAGAFLWASFATVAANSEAAPGNTTPSVQQGSASNDVALAKVDLAASGAGAGLFAQGSPIALPTVNPIQPKKLGSGSLVPRSTWTPTPLPSPTATASPTPKPTYVSNGPGETYLRPLGMPPGEKWIDVNLTSQTLVAYEGALPVFETLVSSGTARHPTVTGQFRIWLRFQSQDMDGYRLGFDYYLRNVPYVQYFYQDYALHGTFWHNNFGTPMSHGCVNLPTPAAEWLFNWAANGTLVNIHH